MINLLGKELLPSSDIEMSDEETEIHEPTDNGEEQEQTTEADQQEPQVEETQEAVEGQQQEEAQQENDEAQEETSAENGETQEEAPAENGAVEQDGNKETNGVQEEGDQQEETHDQQEKTGDQQEEIDDQQDEMGNQQEETQDQLQEETADQQEETGDQQEETGEQQEETGDQQEETGDQQEETGEQQEETGDQQEETGEQQEESGDQQEETGNQLEDTQDQPQEETNDQQEETQQETDPAEDQTEDHDVAETTGENAADIEPQQSAQQEETEEGSGLQQAEDPDNENNNAGDVDPVTQDGEKTQENEEQEQEAGQEQENKEGDGEEKDEEQPEEGQVNTVTQGQQTTPKTTPAQSHGAPTPGGHDTPAEGRPQEQDEEQQQLDDADHHLEEKGTPEPPTEHIGTEVDEAQLDPGVQHHTPSPVPQYDKDATATVKFVLLPTQQVATLRCHLTQSLYELKQHFAQELKIPASAIVLMLNGKGTADRMTLAELGVGPNGTIRLEMQSADPDNQPIKAFKPRQEYTMPDVISVRVNSDGVLKDVVVEIERGSRKKNFLGGYRHKSTGVEYHHASAQTRQKPRPPPAVERFCRDTQTVQQKHIVQQTTNDMSTQMTNIGVYVSNLPDKLMVPGSYTTADDFKMNMLSQVITIQKYYRRWLAQRFVDKVRDDKKEREEWEREEELRKKKEKEDRIRREFERRMNPKTKEDFDLLYHALEEWRQEEKNKINETLSGAERKAALCQLLDQETQLIASIGRHKLEADGENKDKHVQAFLDKAASPKKWRGPDGKATEMDTPYTLRAQELRDIYNSINMKYLTQDERLDVLLTLKHTVKEHDCKLTQEIIELIDREADLLMRAVKESNLDGLRKRISTLFMQYIKTPTFNPEAARLLKVPQDPSVLRKNIYFCPSCNQYLPSTEFQLSSNSSGVGKCRKCNKTDNDARVRQDYSHYRFMLKSVRRSEEVYGDGSKIAFLLQENDLRYMVENVWNSQSVLSAWEDLYDLVLVRWDRHEEWSPWNCILLTKEEATAHDKLESLEEAYGKVFIHKVKHKHTLARNYFSRMPGMAEHMRSRNSSAVPNGPAVSGRSLSIASAKA